MASHQHLIFPVLLGVAVGFVLLALPTVHGQFNMPCTTSMLTSFTPCMNFITNSSLNGSSPTAQCCNVLKSLMANGTDCMCLIVTGSVPFRIPINRTLALSLPSACNMPGVPLQCKASGAPIPAPGPLANGPAMSPGAAPSPEDIGSSGPLPVSPSLAPGGDETPPTLTPPSPTVNSGSPPSTNSGNRQAVNPSAASASTHTFSPLLLLLVGAIALKLY